MSNEKRLIDATEARKHSTHDFITHFLDRCPTVDAVEVVHAHWEDGVCSNCKEEALSTSWDEPIYDYDWEENLRYSHTETHTEYHLTDYCPNCGAKMDGGNEGG